MKYCKGYKYQLRETFSYQTGIKLQKDISAPLVRLTKDGELIIEKYFAWDGASGPTWDDKTNMRAALVHDALYYLMRMGQLPYDYREAADNLLEKIMIDDNAFPIRARYYKWAVKQFGIASSRRENKRVVLTAP